MKKTLLAIISLVLLTLCACNMSSDIKTNLQSGGATTNSNGIADASSGETIASIEQASGTRRFNFNRIMNNTTGKQRDGSSALTQSK